jgi:hypothetical protein
MSSNDILFSRGVANATIVTSGTKLAAGVIPGPLTAPLENVDFQVFGDRGILIPIYPVPTESPEIPYETPRGAIRYNSDVERLEFASGYTWERVLLSSELSENQFQYINATHYVADKKLAIIPGIGTASESDISAAVTLDIKSTEPHTLMRNISSVEGKSSLFMLGGTGNETTGAVNGFELKTSTVNTTYGSKLEINPIIRSNLSTTLNSVTITPYGTEITSSLISITAAINDPTLKVKGSAHTTQGALLVDKEDTTLFAPASIITDTNKIATFSYTANPVLDILSRGRIQINGATGAVLAVQAINGANPGYLARFSQGGYTGTDLGGIFVEISNATTGDLAVFNSRSGTTIVSAAKLDGSGTLFLRNNLSVGGILSVAGITRLSNLFVTTNANISGVLSVTGLTQLSNLSVTTNTRIGGALSVLGSETITGNLSVGGTLNVTGNSTIGNLSVTNSLTISSLNASAIVVNSSLEAVNGTFGNLTVTGSATIGTFAFADLATGNLSVSSNVSVGGSTIIAGSLSVVGGTTVTGILSVGSARIASNLSVGSGLSVAGLVTCSANLSVGTNARINGVLSVGNNSFIVGNLSVSGKIRCDEIIVADQFRLWWDSASSPNYVAITDLTTAYSGSLNTRNVRANNFFSSTTNLNNQSDKRLKKNIRVLSDTLNTIRSLRPVSFEFKDSTNVGKFIQQYGFIAQELEKIFPDAVIKSPGLVNDLYGSYSCDLNENAISINPDEQVGLCIITIKGKRGTKDVEITKIDPNTHCAYFNEGAIDEEDLDESKMVFIYGNKVDDSRFISKDFIFTLNVSATQDLDRKVSSLEQCLEQLNQENAFLKEQLSILTHRVNQLAQ